MQEYIVFVYVLNIYSNSNIFFIKFYLLPIVYIISMINGLFILKLFIFLNRYANIIVYRIHFLHQTLKVNIPAKLNKRYNCFIKSLKMNT
jgi:hypothetical protein